MTSFRRVVSANYQPIGCGINLKMTLGFTAVIRITIRVIDFPDRLIRSSRRVDRVDCCHPFVMPVRIDWQEVSEVANACKGVTVLEGRRDVALS